MPNRNPTILALIICKRCQRIIRLRQASKIFPEIRSKTMYFKLLLLFLEFFQEILNSSPRFYGFFTSFFLSFLLIQKIQNYFFVCLEFYQIFLISLRQFLRKKATLKYLNNHVWQVTLQVTLFALVLSAEHLRQPTIAQLMLYS